MKAVATTKPRSRIRRMLALSGAALLLTAIVAGGIYGPDLWNMVQLGHQIDIIAAEEAHAGGAWPRATEVCTNCHGQNGNARAQTYPHLAGQPEVYLKKQLMAFANGERSDTIMTPLALSMSEQEMAGYAAHFSRMQALSNTSFKADAAAVARGELLAKANNCTACHGQQLEGKDGFPRLAGQGYDYLRNQLARFKQGTRRDASGAMPAVATSLSQQNIEDLAQYLASR